MEISLTRSLVIRLDIIKVNFFSFPSILYRAIVLCIEAASYFPEVQFQRNFLLPNLFICVFFEFMKIVFNFVV